MNEIEVKARVQDLNVIRKKLKALGIKLSPPIVQEDRVYFPKGTTYNPETGRPNSKVKLPALRIRQEGDKYLFTYKIPMTNDLDKREFESEVSNPEAIASICDALGFELNVLIRKSREKAHFKDYEVCLDTVDELGTFIEVEKFSDGNAAKVQDELWDFMTKLGVNREDEEFLGYDILMRKKEYN